MHNDAINKLIEIMLQHCDKVHATLADEPVFSKNNKPDAGALYAHCDTMLLKGYDEDARLLGDICIDLYPNNRHELIIDRDVSRFSDTVVAEYEDWCEGKTK